MGVITKAAWISQTYISSIMRICPGDYACWWQAGGGGGWLPYTIKAASLSHTHTLISFCLQIAFPSSLACVCVRCFVCTYKHTHFCLIHFWCKKKKKKKTHRTNWPVAGSLRVILLAGGPGALSSWCSGSRACSGAVRAQVPANRSSPGGHLDCKLSDVWAV